MITDENAVLISRGPITVRVQRDARSYRGVVALFDGDGTHDRPLHFVFLACHADMADDAPIATTERMTSTLAEGVLAQLRDTRRQVRDVLRTSNVAAEDTGRYYSIAVGRIMDRDVTVGGLGKVHAILVRGNARTPIIAPNVVQIGDQAILDGSFGIGFKEEAVNATQLKIEDDTTLLLVIGEVATIDARDIVGHQGVESLIEHVARDAETSPPIIAVVL